MAYLQFAEIASGSPYPAAFDRKAEAPVASFSALEWSVVALAQRDRLSSLREPGAMAVALGVLFGPRQNPRLADPKLEALRRLSVHAWHRGYAVPKSAIRDFHAAGYTSDHYEVLLASISRGRTALQRKN